MKPYNFFSQVTSKKTGFPGIGYIIGMVSEYMYPKKIERWDILYPKWRQKPIYYVSFETKRKSMTKEEIASQYPDKKDWEIEEMFQNQKETNVIAYVHDDLELVEE